MTGETRLVLGTARDRSAASVVGTLTPTRTPTPTSTLTLTRTLALTLTLTLALALALSRWSAGGRCATARGPRLRRRQPLSLTRTRCTTRTLTC